MGPKCSPPVRTGRVVGVLQALRTHALNPKTLRGHLVAARGDSERGARVGAQVGRVAGQRAEGKHWAPRLVGLCRGEPMVRQLRKPY